MRGRCRGGSTASVSTGKSSVCTSGDSVSVAANESISSSDMSCRSAAAARGCGAAGGAEANAGGAGAGETATDATEAGAAIGACEAGAAEEDVGNTGRRAIIDGLWSTLAGATRVGRVGPAVAGSGEAASGGAATDAVAGITPCAGIAARAAGAIGCTVNGAGCVAARRLRGERRLRGDRRRAATGGVRGDRRSCAATGGVCAATGGGRAATGGGCAATGGGCAATGGGCTTACGACAASVPAPGDTLAPGVTGVARATSGGGSAELAGAIPNISATSRRSCAVTTVVLRVAASVSAVSATLFASRGTPPVISCSAASASRANSLSRAPPAAFTWWSR